MKKKQFACNLSHLTQRLNACLGLAGLASILLWPTLYCASVNADEAQATSAPDCGVLAAEAVLDSFQFKFRSSREFVDLCQRRPLSLADLKTLFERYDLEVQTYRLPEAPKSLLTRAHSTNCQAILLLPAQSTLATSRENPGHYTILVDWSEDAIESLDPTTGIVQQIDFEINPGLAEACFIQFVESRSDRFFTTSIGTRNWVYLGLGLLSILAFGWSILHQRSEANAGRNLTAKDI